MEIVRKTMRGAQVEWKKMASRLWNRSEELFAMRYTTMISDGDSSSFLALEQEQPYGTDRDKQVHKEECINHVSKRLGTRLRKLKKTHVQ